MRRSHESRRVGRARPRQCSSSNVVPVEAVIKEPVGVQADGMLDAAFRKQSGKDIFDGEVLAVLL